MKKSNLTFSNIELSFFCNQLAMVLTSGISLVEGLALMSEETTDESERELLSRLSDSLMETGSFYESLERTGLFPSYMTQMVKIGEETGKLDNVFTALTQHYDREDSIQNSIRHALIYPLIMLGMISLVILILLMKVMPIFQQVFIQLGTEMTGFSGMLVSLGQHLSNYSLLLIIVLVLLAFFIYAIIKKNIHRIPFTKKMYEKIAACRFAGGMALALSSGLNTDLSMDLVCSLNEDTYFAKKLELCRQKVNEGEDFSKALMLSGIFTGIHARMASIGNKSGAMDLVMDQIAEAYQEEVDNNLNQLLAIIEPTLVIILSLIVGSILMSVMFPLIGIMSSL